ncbi:MAG: PKD domain-containing protein [Opitutales bacterium]|nr:PKD domain-containing protein [Opitutales bacterium]
MIRSFPFVFAVLLSFFSAAAALRAEAPALLFVTPERLAELQSAVQVPGSHHAEAYAAIMERVDSTRMDLTDLSFYQYGGNPRDYALGWFAREAAFIYRITENPVYAQSAFAALERVYQSPDPSDSRLLTNSHGLSRGMMGVAFALTYNWAWEGLTPAQRGWLLDRLTEGLNMWPTFSHTNLGGTRASNWVAVVRGSELIMLLATEMDRDRLVRHKFLRSELQRHIQTYSREGWTHEGNGYLSYGGQFLVPAVLALRHRGDHVLLEDYITRSSHVLAMFAGAFDEAQSVTQWSVGGPGFDPEGWTSAMLGIIPGFDLPRYKWFYDRFRGIHNPATAQEKFDHRRAGTVWSLLYYPEHLSAINPHAAFSPLLRDPDAGFWMRSGWHDEDDVIVSLSADAKGFNQGWDEADALQLNILYGGTHFASGPGKSQEPALFSSLLVNGEANNSPAHLGRAGASFVSPDGAYAVVEGHQKYANMGVASVRRHLLADFSGAGAPAILSVLDRIQNEQVKLYTWQLNTMNLPATQGMEAGLPTFTVYGNGDAWLKGWVLTPMATLAVGANVRVDLFAASADIWVVMAVGGGTPPVASITGTGLSSVLTLGGTQLRFDAPTGYLESSGQPHLQRPPTAAFTATPAAGLPPLAVAFNAAGSSDPDGDALSYQWDFGDGTAATGVTANKIYEQEGAYIVRLHVSDGRGGTDLTTRVIHVGNRAPTAHIAATPTSGLPPLAVNLDATGSSDPEGDPLTFEWHLGNNGPIVYGPVVDHVFPAGNHLVSLIVRDSAGNWDTATVTINAQNQPPVARARSFPSGGSTETVIAFDGSRSTDPEGMALTYTWDFDDGTVLTDAGPFVTHTFTQPGSYRVRLTVTDPLGASNSHRMDSIQIISPSDLRASISPPAGLAPGLNYKYYQGSYSSIPDFNPKSPIKAGRVETLNHEPRLQNEMFQFVYSGYILIPEDGAYVFHLRSIGGTHLYIGDDLVLDADWWQVGTERWTTVGLKAGYHPVRVHYNYRNAGIGRDEHLLDFHWVRPGATSLERVPSGVFFSSPSTLASSLMSSPSEGRAPLTVVFESTALDPEGGELTYLWNFGDGNTSTQRKVTHTFTQFGVYEVTLRVTSSSGASDLSGTIVHVVPHGFRRIDKTNEPGGIVFARGENGINEGRLKAFDNSLFTKWLDFSPTTWIEYHFNQGGQPRRHVIGMYSISSANDVHQRDPHNWTLSGSNDGVTWTVLDTRTGEQFPSRHMTRYFIIDNTTAYSAYRLDIECKQGEITQLSQIEFFDFMTAPSPAGNQAPTDVSLTASRLSGEAPMRVDFSLSASDPDGDLLYYDWDFGDGQVTDFRIQPDVSHTFHTVGTHTVTATVRDSRNAIVQRTVEIQVLPPSANAAPVIHLTTSATDGPAAHTVHFDARQSHDPDGDPIDFHWEFGDGYAGHGPIVAHTYRAA